MIGWVFFVVPSLMCAQGTLDKVFEKYAGQERFTTVNVSKEMFQMFGQMIEQKDTSMTELKEVMNLLTGLKVITYTIDASDYAKAVSIYNEFTGLYPAKDYKELLTVNEGRENFRFLTKQDASGKISEMVMLGKGKDEVMVLSLTGIIDLSKIQCLSRGIGVKGMEGLKKIKEHHHDND